MQATVKSATGHGSGVVGAAVATAAIAFGMAYFAISAAHEDTTTSSVGDEGMDTTERLLSGGNRARTLLALEQFNQGNFVEFALPDFERELA